MCFGIAEANQQQYFNPTQYDILSFEVLDIYLSKFDTQKGFAPNEFAMKDEQRGQTPFF